MQLDTITLLQEFGVYFELQREGWVNVRCPMCDDRSCNGGFNDAGYYHCWRCGGHEIGSVVSELLNVSRRESFAIVSNYTQRYAINRKKEEQQFARKIDLPGSELTKLHRDYLAKRNFDADKLVREYELRGTAFGERAFKLDYSYRIVIPLKDAAGRVIGCQGRDVTGRHKLRYLGSPLDQSLADYKHTLYNDHRVKGSRVAVVEGVFDAWRLGDGFVATFGTAMTKAQLRALAKYDQIFFLFDDETAAQDKAKGYARELAAIGKQVENVCLDLGDGRDAADLSDKDAYYIRAELGFR